ncbi:IclR family transcriptional regulator [Desulfobacula toluolica]|uniref:Transcriptional regulator, IclR family n=1 Tax=Desulfobacula toluolica (strain DSM 7467 / Tol2) TaxID=651182 RepID=K0NF05_DESTT|nr:IclR family transcriptional regulator [Desulfobacula toluolica]CCK79721.1 transcriptional regulator, IclR family [Desulfobacula toluolica Tol2]
MSVEFKAVPAIYKCFDLIDLLSKTRKSLGISAIASALGYHRSTVFNIVYSLVDLGILERDDEGKFHLGSHFYQLSKTAGKSTNLVQTARPYLEEINLKTGLTAFLVVRSALNAVVVEKADSITGFKISTEVGHSHSLFVGAGGKALLCQLTDHDLDHLLATNDLVAFTPFSCVDKVDFKKMIQKVQKEGVAFDREEYTEGIHAVAVPLYVSKTIPAAIYVVGLKKMLPEKRLRSWGEFIKHIADKIQKKMTV